MQIRGRDVVRSGCVFVAILLLFAMPAASHAAPPSKPIEFNRDVRPILSENCFACHGFDPKHREAGLRLDTFEGATADRDGSRGIVPGNLSESALWQRITSADPDEVMPPPKSHKPALSATQREIFKKWIEQGAKYERHWAFEPPQRTAPPAGVHPIDHFIEARLKEEGLSFSPEADPRTLIRRVSLDLTGLPPTPEEVEAFVKEYSRTPAPPDSHTSGTGVREHGGTGEKAYQALVERLLSSPHYGERWGRWWLDQARYADSNGYSIDAPRQIWKFRDWVIAALNADMPFDQFTIEQLAGDLLPDATESQKIATGFHRNTQINQEGGIDREQFRIDSVFDRVATTGTVWLGLTVGCAQCHDHKFDPIEHKEYYRLFAFLNNQDEPTLKVFDPSVDVSGLTAEFKETEAQLVAYMKEHADELAEWEAGLTPEIKKSISSGILKTLAVPREKRSFAQNRNLFAGGIGGVGPFRQLNDRYTELDTILNQGITTMVMKELPKPRKTTVFIKGDFTRPADEVTPGTPAVLHPFDAPQGQPNRLDLARWLVSPRNPLTARVIANRVWQQYFGRGIVETDNDFGMQGTAPSHPELLDWLAVSFAQGSGTERSEVGGQRSGAQARSLPTSDLRLPTSSFAPASSLQLPVSPWSLKHLHRLIVTSRTYRQSSADTPALREKDPQNYLLARQRRLRLDAEVVRDVALAASGLLSPKLGGPPVFPPIPDGVMGQGQVKRVWAVSKGEDKYRRGLYTFVYRASPPPSLTVFDAPDGFSTCTRRLRSNTPLQALTLMNDGAFFEFATALEKIIERDGLEAAFRRCTSRSPKPDELAVLQKLDKLTAARTLLNLDETLTRE